MCELIPAAEPLPLFVKKKKKKSRSVWKFGVTKNSPLPLTYKSQLGNSQKSSTLTGFNVKDIDSIRKQQ